MCSSEISQPIVPGLKTIPLKFFWDKINFQSHFAGTVRVKIGSLVKCMISLVSVKAGR